MPLSEAARALRRGRVGASEAAALPLIDEHPFMTAADLYDRVVLGIVREANERMAIGNLLEATVLDLARRLRGIRCRACHRGYVHPTLPMSASPDAYALDGSGLVEVKVTSAWAEDMPRYVHWQVQQQLLLTGRDYCHVVVLNGTRLNVTTVPYSREDADRLLEAVVGFDQDHIRPRIRPMTPELVFTDRQISLGLQAAGI